MVMAAMFVIMVMMVVGVAVTLTVVVFMVVVLTLDTGLTFAAAAYRTHGSPHSVFYLYGTAHHLYSTSRSKSRIASPVVACTR
jgi:hypothetical protein